MQILLNCILLYYICKCFLVIDTKKHARPLQATQHHSFLYISHLFKHTKHTHSKAIAFIYIYIEKKMAILPAGEYFESLRRHWRRRKYQRISGATHSKRKLQVLRLGGGAADAPRRRRLWRIRRIPKLHWKIVSPIKLLAKLSDAYAGMMICLANKMANGGFLRGKKPAKPRHLVWASTGDQVDTRLVEEIYKQLVASRRLSTEMQL